MDIKDFQVVLSSICEQELMMVLGLVSAEIIKRSIDRGEND